MTPKHTPGPWEEDIRLSDGKRIRAVNAKGEDEYLALVFDLRRLGQRGMPTKKEIKEADANALLIAAAPELLEALIMVRDAHLDAVSDNLPPIPATALAYIEAAIAKAEGSKVSP